MTLSFISLLFFFSPTSIILATPEDWPCDHEIFCKPDESVLHEIQLAKIFKDSKTFVDMPMKFNIEKVLENFKKLTDHSRTTLETFVKENFDDEGTELETIQPSDWRENPKFIDEISDDTFKDLALEMNNIWKNLTRKIAKSKEEIEEKSSLIYLEHPFVVPGGRCEKDFFENHKTINFHI